MLDPRDIPSSLNCAVAGAEVDIEKILGHNPEFAGLEESKAQHVLKLVKTVFAPYWADHGLIHENIFDEIFAGEENIDKLRNRLGQPLNLLATDRQRFMMDNHTEWRQEIANRKSAATTAALVLEESRKARAEAVAAKPLRTRECTNMGCANSIDITNGTLKKQNEALWRSCPGKGCRSWACPSDVCTLALSNHIARCQKVAAPVE